MNLEPYLLPILPPPHQYNSGMEIQALAPDCSVLNATWILLSELSFGSLVILSLPVCDLHTPQPLQNWCQLIDFFFLSRSLNLFPGCFAVGGGQGQLFFRALSEQFSMMKPAK